MALDKQKGFVQETANGGKVTEDESDDFIIIDIKRTTDSDRAENTTAEPASSKPSEKQVESSSFDSGVDIEDFVEISYEDVQQGVGVTVILMNMICSVSTFLACNCICVCILYIIMFIIIYIIYI